MENTPLISVILPTYRIDKTYFIQCIDSIKRQSYKNWEAIIIDDGNPSEYAAWLDTFAGDRIHIIHQQNSGVSAARNRGVLEAKGEWIFFCDPDDWMHKDELSVLLQAVLTSQAEVAVCQYIEVDGNLQRKSEDDYTLNEFYIVDKKNVNEVLLELIAPGRARTLHRREWMSSCAMVFPWAHLYKASLAKTIQFAPIHPCEDKIFNLCMCEKSESIIFVPLKLHYYRVGSGVTGRFDQKLIDNIIPSCDLFFEFVDSHQWDYDIKREMNKSIMDMISVQTKCILTISKTYSELKKRVENMLISDLYQCAITDHSNPFYTKNERVLCFVYRFKMLRFLRLYWGLIQ